MSSSMSHVHVRIHVKYMYINSNIQSQSINQIFVYSYHLWRERTRVYKSMKKYVNKISYYSQLRNSQLAKYAQSIYFTIILLN